MHPKTTTLIGLAILLFAVCVPALAEAQSLKRMDCSAVRKQADGTFLALSDIVIVDSSDNTFNVSKGTAIGPQSLVSNGVSIHELIEKQCRAAAAPADTRYVYVAGSQPAGPSTIPELSGRIASGELPPSTPVWKDGMPAWAAARDVPELAAALPVENPTTSRSCAPDPRVGFGSGRVIYDDRFADESGGFDSVPGSAAAKGGVYRIDLKPPGVGNWAATNYKHTLIDGDYCLEILLPDVTGDDDVDAGLSVLASDAKNFYLAQIGVDGHFGLFRRSGGDWSNLHGDDGASLVDTSSGAVNVVWIVIRGGMLTASVNGAPVANLRAAIPAVSHFGLYAQVTGSHMPSVVPVRFKRFRVTAP